MARITLVTSDLEIRQHAVGALDGSHDVAAVSPSADPRRAAAGAPDILILEAQHLRSPAGAALVTEAQGQGSGAARPPAILVLIEEGEEQQIVPCFEAGADDYAVVPFGARDLRRKVDGLQALRLGLLSTATHDPIAISDSGMILREPDLNTGASADGAPTQLGRYEVRELVGRGGYGVVYRARDLALGRDVALKVLPRELHGNTEAVARFFREATAISRLDHPNIVRFYEVGSYQGRLYFTMELVEGRTLKDIADKEAPLPAGLSAYYVAEIARALAAIDSIGLVHRDVKPENVLVTHDGRVKLIDFGLVRIQDTADITSQEDVLGTPYFMCPEYIRAPGVPDIRYDLYALGVTFFNLLSGEYPFDGKNAAQVMEKHLRAPAPKISDFQPEVPALAEWIIERLLRKDPERRLQTPTEVVELLQPLINGATVAA